jgi:hypothetical protein
MKVTTKTCDRCGASIESGGAIFRCEAGEPNRRFTEPLDLCSRCTDLLENFLREGREVKQEAARKIKAG